MKTYGVFLLGAGVAYFLNCLQPLKMKGMLFFGMVNTVVGILLITMVE